MGSPSPAKQFTLVPFEGIEALKTIYESQLLVKGELCIVRSQNAMIYDQHFGEWWTGYLERRTKKGIAARVLTPDDPAAIHDERIDAMRRITRTWLEPHDYTAPVEIDIFGDTVAVIAFGKTISGYTVVSKEIATAFRSLFMLAERGAKTEPVTHNHPWSLALTN